MNFKKYFYLPVFTVFWLTVSCELEAPSAPDNGNIPVDIRDIIFRSNLDSLINTVKILSGEDSVLINNQYVTILSRHADQPGNELVPQYLRNKLKGYGFEVYTQDYSESGSNVYAVQTGTDDPESYYILCAHYDSMPDSSVAPGADDNASGCAAVMEAARLLREFQPRKSVIYAFWDEEEQGLVGSKFFAEQAAEHGMNILGVINLDMIGWDGDINGEFLISWQGVAESQSLAMKVRDVRNLMSIDLVPDIMNRVYASDNCSFWLAGYSAISVSERYGKDWNPYYHTTADLPGALNLTYFFNISKLCTGIVASLAEIQVQKTSAFIAMR